MHFAKYQALGNDYIVLEDEAIGPLHETTWIPLMCDRHFGVGSDGVLVGGSVNSQGHFLLRIFNPDGTEAEKSGNGLRIFARYLWDKELVRNEPFDVVTPGGTVTCRVLEDGKAVSVKMGQVRFNSTDIPVAGPPREVLRETLTVGGQALEYSAATIGNPHCVIIRDHVSAKETRALGPLLETAPQFPNRTNVQFLKLLDRHNIRIEIWERGAGYTLASGSSSCAAAAVARKLDLCEATVTVHMPGGRLSIEIQEDFTVQMTGPVAKVFTGEYPPLFRLREHA